MAERPPSRSHGFTLTELVISIVVIGILAAIAMPRFVSSKGFASRGFYDEAQAVVRFAQKTAIAWRRSITVCVSATQISAITNANCAAPVPLYHPTNPTAELKTTVPDGVTLSVLPAGGFSFDGMGRPSATATITLTSTVTDDPVRQILVAAETGYVSHNP
jgi:MSHA pilin protein MshC